MRFSEITPMPTAGTAPAVSGSPASSTNPAGAATGDPQAQAKMMAQQALDRANQKKQIQDAIKQKQQELTNLQKQLATLK